MKITRILSAVAISAMALAGPAAMVMTAAPALADVVPITAGDASDSPDIPLQMCQASGTGCTRDANNLDSTGNFVVTGTEITGPAENSKFVYNGNHLMFNGNNFPEGTLKFTGHTNLCIGTKSVGMDPNLYTRHCSGDTGIIWLHGRANGADVWINRLWTQSSINGLGDYQVLEGGDPGAPVISMFIISYNNHNGFVRYEFR
jgi:hypothetical protein